MAKRGRPESKPIEESPTKFTREYLKEDGSGTKWSYDLNKSTKGPMSVEVVYPKGHTFPSKPKIDSSKYAGKEPVVMVYKTSENKNAKYKLKTWNNKNLDQILIGKNIGVPDGVIILELGVGTGLIEDYKQKYKSNLK